MIITKQIVDKYLNRRKTHTATTKHELDLIRHIKQETMSRNLDNISRTRSYGEFYDRNKEIRWSFLASMVSRNAGWNMTDLEGAWFPQVLDKETRKTFFMTYEKANWLIFNDAYPQLLLYELSKKLRTPLFYLLKECSVSLFMEIQWERYWELGNGDLLVTSQIINEQNVIQKPVIEHPIYKKKVFSSFVFRVQDWLHFSSVLFPTINGELYGFSVHDFRKVTSRIELGKRLAWLLFHKEYYCLFYRFSKKTEHTGSRYDYEQYFATKKLRDTPYLRTTFPLIDHRVSRQNEWFHRGINLGKWYSPINQQQNFELTSWYRKKQRQLQLGISIEKLFKKEQG